MVNGSGGLVRGRPWGTIRDNEPVFIPFRSSFAGTRLDLSAAMRKKFFGTFALTLWASTAVGALSLISVNDEIKLGQQAQREVRQQVPELRDSVVDGYVTNMGRRLAAAAGGPRYPYSFDVANYREVNAFALPGGPIWVHRGTIDVARNEAQLAGVMAHEIAHIASRHAASQLTKGTVANVGLGILGALIGDSTGARIAQLGAGVAAQATMMKFSRDAEREADMKALQYMKRAGYDPRGMVEFLQVLRAQQGRDPGSVQTFFASHPAPGERVRRLEQEANRLAGGRRDSAGFQQVQSRLDRMPAAQSMRRR
jgi:predicted Zn-dependent protease